MKQGWEVKKISQVCDIYNGGTPDTSKKQYWDGSHLWITPKDMGKLGSVYVNNTARKITDEGLKNCSAKILPIDAVILSSRAPIGHLAINTMEISTNQGCKGLVPKKNTDTKFLYYFLKHSVDLLNKLGSGTTFKELSSTKLADVDIPIPPLPEQQRIVALLDQAFAAIATAKANAEKNLQNARELFQAYLDEIFSNPSFDWETTTLGESLKFIDYRGRTPPKTSSGIRLITAKNVKNGFLQYEPTEFIDSSLYESWMTRGIPQKGDVVFTTEAPLANVAQLDTNDKVAFAQRIIIFQPKVSNLDTTFLKYLLLSNPIKKKILSNGTGATVQGIKASLLKLIPIYYPKTLDNQNEIVNKLDALLLETKELEKNAARKIVDLDELKQSLLHKAFSGEL